MEQIILAVVIGWGIMQVHALHYRNSLHEKLVKDFWVALQALKAHVEHAENSNMDEVFIAAFETMHERLGTLEPKVEDDVDG